MSHNSTFGFDRYLHYEMSNFASVVQIQPLEHYPNIAMASVRRPSFYVTSIFEFTILLVDLTSPDATVFIPLSQFNLEEKHHHKSITSFPTCIAFITEKEIIIANLGIILTFFPGSKFSSKDSLDEIAGILDNISEYQQLLKILKNRAKEEMELEKKAHTAPKSPRNEQEDEIQEPKKPKGNNFFYPNPPISTEETVQDKNADQVDQDLNFEIWEMELGLEFSAHSIQKQVEKWYLLMEQTIASKITKLDTITHLPKIHLTSPLPPEIIPFKDQMALKIVKSSISEETSHASEDQLKITNKDSLSPLDQIYEIARYQETAPFWQYFSYTEFYPHQVIIEPFREFHYMAPLQKQWVGDSRRIERSATEVEISELLLNQISNIVSRLERVPTPYLPAFHVPVEASTLILPPVNFAEADENDQLAPFLKWYKEAHSDYGLILWEKNSSYALYRTFPQIFITSGDALTVNLDYKWTLVQFEPIIKTLSPQLLWLILAEKIELQTVDLSQTMVGPFEIYQMETDTINQINPSLLIDQFAPWKKDHAPLFQGLFTKAIVPCRTLSKFPLSLRLFDPIYNSTAMIDMLQAKDFQFKVASFELDADFRLDDDFSFGNAEDLALNQADQITTETHKKPVPSDRVKNIYADFDNPALHYAVQKEDDNDKEEAPQKMKQPSRLKTPPDTEDQLKDSISKPAKNRSIFTL